MSSATMLRHRDSQRETKFERPQSIATDISDRYDTDFEDDDDSDFEETLERSSLQSSDQRRRSQTTLSSFEEAPTPRSSNSHQHFGLHEKPAVQGPRGPHLFRASQISVEFAFDNALQLSPLFPEKAPLRTGTAFTEHTVTPELSFGFSPPTLDDVLHDSDVDQSSYEEEIRQWSTQEVIDWMFTSGLDTAVIESLEIHDVNGAVLLDLEFEDLRELDIVSFGKRHQLWNAIMALRGIESKVSPTGTPFQDISRPCTSNEKRSLSGTIADKKRRGRKTTKGVDTIMPAESVSIVAIEQLLPKPHKCAKGERCAKWRKQQRELEQLRADDKIGVFPVSPTKGGRIFVAGDPGNAMTAENMIPNVRMQTEAADAYRQSESFPSVVASSDLLGPGQLPTLTLHADALDQVEHRDPQDNVRKFLQFQHLQSPIDEGDACQEEYEDVNRSQSVPPLFPEQHHQAYPSLYKQNAGAFPHEQLRQLPRLEIPRSSSAAPTLTGLTSPQNGFAGAYAIPRSATASPGAALRLGTPASEMDVPVTAIPLTPLARDASQSVPPNMQYRQQNLSRSNSRSAHANDRRRRSTALPAVKEGEVFDAVDSRRSSEDKVSDPAHHAPEVKQFGYGSDYSHAGWMKKRKTKMLRHEWQDAHFRLKGTQLDMHSSARLSAALVDSIDTDKYSVACSSAASNSKLSSAMKAFNLKNSSGDSKRSKDGDSTAFAFQLVPTRDSEKQSRKMGNTKTHHFAVKSKDERIDWMRELMLAKALQQKGKGYSVEINGMNA